MDLKEFHHVPYCNTSQQLKLVAQMEEDFLWKEAGWSPSSCNCDQRPCTYSSYEAYSDSYTRHDNCSRYTV